jgi:hypothetical protein
MIPAHAETYAMPGTLLVFILNCATLHHGAGKQQHACMTLLVHGGLIKAMGY